MKLKILNLFLISFCLLNSVYGQEFKLNIETLIEIVSADFFDFDKLERFKNQCNQHKKANADTRKRDLELGLKQEYTTFRFKKNSYTLVLLSKENDLIYIKIHSKYKIWGENYFENGAAPTEYKTFFERIESQNVKKWSIKAKNDISLSEINQENQISFPIEDYTYSVMCGAGAIPPDECMEMIFLVNSEDYSELSNWLNSLNPEIAAYGYFGLYCLERKGLKIQNSEKLTMKHVRSLNILVNSCEGCAYSRQKTMKEILSDEKLKFNYKILKQIGYFELPTKKE